MINYLFFQCDKQRIMYQHLKFGLLQNIESGHLEKVKNECNKTNINKSLYIGRTPLYVAVICSQVDAIKYLLTLEPDLQRKDELGLTVGDWAFYLNNKHVQEMVIPFIPYSEIPQRDWSNLDIYRAAELSSKDLKLKIAKQNPHIKGDFNRTALHWAGLAGNQQSWEILIQKNLNPYAEDEFGFNPLHYLRNKYNPLYHTVERFPDESNQKIDYEVLIIGAGASGIGAAMTLERAGVPYLILQARNRVGGRLDNAFVDGIQLDLGACWVHSFNKNNPVCKEVKKLDWKSKVSEDHYGVQIHDQFNGKVSQKVLGRARFHYQRFFEISQKNAGKSEQDVSIYEAAQEYYENTIAKLPKEEHRVVDMLINMTEHYEAASISELSGKNYDAREDYGADFSPVQSYASLMRKIAERLRVQLHTTVKEILYKQNSVTVVCEEDKVFTSRRVICTLPLGILKAKKIKFDPQLPKQHQTSIDSLGFGTMNKIIMAFQKPFWEQGTSWVRTACDERGKYPHMYNFSTKGKHILCCFVTDNFARKISAWTDEQIIKDITEMLTKAYKKQILLKEVKITKWDRDQYSLGSYTYFQKNSSTRNCINLRQSILKTLWIAGQHCYAEHIGTAHGAFQTGVWAAEDIVRLLKHFEPSKEIVASQDKAKSEEKERKKKN